jgi:hypothetical protein
VSATKAKNGKPRAKAPAEDARAILRDVARLAAQLRERLDDYNEQHGHNRRCRCDYCNATDYGRGYRDVAEPTGELAGESFNLLNADEELGALSGAVDNLEEAMKGSNYLRGCWPE